MSVAGILAPIVIYLAAAMTAHPAGLQPVRSEPPPKETLIININGGNYREADGTVVLGVIASNSTTRDAVITAAHLVHISLTPGGDLVFGYKKSGHLPLFKPLTVGGGKAQVCEVISEVDLADFYNDGLEPTNLPEDRRSNARAGRLFLELRAIDGFGRTYQNYFRIGGRSRVSGERHVSAAPRHHQRAINGCVFDTNSGSGDDGVREEGLRIGLVNNALLSTAKHRRRVRKQKRCAQAEQRRWAFLT